MNIKKVILNERLKQLFASAKRIRPGRPPTWLHPTFYEREYSRILLEFVGEIENSISDNLLSALPAIISEANTELLSRQDSWVDSIQRLMTVVTIGLSKRPDELKAQVLNIGQKTNKWNSEQWQKTLRTVLGVSTLQYDSWLNDQLSSFTEENIGLIKSIRDKAIGDVGAYAQRAVRSGLRHEAIAKEIKGQFDLTKGRAKLIARDQVSKLNGQLTMLRQQEIGIEYYIWHTSGDERVRKSHSLMNGKICKWDDSTVFLSSGKWIKRSSINGIELHPGIDYQCRCWPEPVFDLSIVTLKGAA